MLEVVKKSLSVEAFRVGNKFIDFDGSISEWCLSAYNDYSMPSKKDGKPYIEKIKGIKINYKIAKKLGFKFANPKERIGRLHVKAGNHYLWKAGRIRMEVTAQMFVGKEIMLECLGVLKNKGLDTSLLDEWKKGLKSEVAPVQMKGDIEIEHLHDLQNHMFFVHGVELDVSNVK